MLLGGLLLGGLLFRGSLLGGSLLGGLLLRGLLLGGSLLRGSLLGGLLLRDSLLRRQNSPSDITVLQTPTTSYQRPPGTRSPVRKSAAPNPTPTPPASAAPDERAADTARTTLAPASPLRECSRGEPRRRLRTLLHLWTPARTRIARARTQSSSESRNAGSSCDLRPCALRRRPTGGVRCARGRRAARDGPPGGGRARRLGVDPKNHVGRNPRSRRGARRAATGPCSSQPHAGS